MPTGYVYVLANPMYPDLLKIGHTTLQVPERAAELSRATGVVQPFVIEYWRLTLKAKEVERSVHEFFAARRENKKREFFHVSLEEAIAAIERHSRDPAASFLRVPPKAMEPSVKEKMFKGKCGNCSRTIELEIKSNSGAVVCPYCRRRTELTRFLRQRHFGL